MPVVLKGHGGFVKMEVLPKFGTVNSHSIYTVAAVWKVSITITHKTNDLKSKALA